LALKLTILGCGSALPAKKRNPSAQILETPDGLFLIDCGEGTQLRLRQEHVKIQSISHILISHMHGDHYLGLVGLLSTMNLLGRKKEIHIMGPEPLQEMVESHSRFSSSMFQFPVQYSVTDSKKSEVIYDSVKLEISTLPLKHRIPTTGFYFREKPKPRRLIKAILEQYDVPIKERVDITLGADFIKDDGSVISNKTLTKDPSLSLSYAYCSDTGYMPALAKRIEGCSLLYHESTFMEAEKARAKKTMHSTAAQAASIAKEAGVKHLLLGHYSARYTELDALYQEALAVFPQTILGIQGLVIDIDKICS
jgi:ribonuclease Z